MPSLVPVYQFEYFNTKIRMFVRSSEHATRPAIDAMDGARALIQTRLDVPPAHLTEKGIYDGPPKG